MATMMTGNKPDLLDARVSKYFFDTVSLWPKEYPSWCNMKKATKNQERIGQSATLPMPDEIGENEAFDEAVFVEGPGQTWDPVKFGFRVLASRELLWDQLHPVLDRVSAAAGKAMAHRLETEGAADLNNAFTVANINDDTEYLIQEDHAAWSGAGGGTQSNMPATGITLGVDSLWAGVDNFATLNDEEGNPAMVIPARLFIHSSGKRVAVEILQSEKVAYRATHETNAIRQEGISFKVGHYLSSSTAWFLSSREKSIEFYFWWQPEVEVENTLVTQTRAWQISTRLGHGPYDWKQIYGTDGTP